MLKLHKVCIAKADRATLTELFAFLFFRDKLIRVVPRNNDELEVLISLENHDDIDVSK